MDHILDNVPVINITSNTTDILVAVAPILELLAGVLLALFVITKIVEFLSKKKVKISDNYDDYFFDDFDEGEYE
jgi:hypothetical protein